MQRPGHKINTREANPNDYITFIRPLPNKKNHEAAEHILKAVAAQVKKIMEQRFMLVGTLEEAEYNRVFAGRNWNHGQSIELVLRRDNGQFFPLPYIMMVMCHEMAHITHMNHGKDFQKLNAAIRADVAEMQRRGYYGDGFWSDGKRLFDGARLGADGLKAADFPEYICGVTKSDARQGRRRGRGPASSRAPGLVKGEASHRSGRQTEYRRKAGRRNNVDMGGGVGRLDGRQQITAEDKQLRKEYIDIKTTQLVREGLDLGKAKRKAADMFSRDNPWWKEGSTRGKKAASKTAAQLRAEAAERRLNSTSTPEINDGDEEDELESEEADSKADLSDGDDYEIIEDPHLTLEARRQELADDQDDEEEEDIGGDWWKEFLAGPGSCSRSPVKRELSDPPAPPPTKRQAGPSKPSPATSDQPKSTSSRTQPTSGNTSQDPTRFNALNLIRQERLRALGLAATTSARTSHALGSGAKPDDPSASTAWACQRCTFVNDDGQGRCGEHERELADG